MQRQYNELKSAYPDTLLFFRLGDFYEMFGPDALEASQILGITLTTRDKASENPLPMCGVPHHAAENYLAKLTKAGKKVAIAEQVSDPNLPGLTKREVVRVVTPGTTFSEQLLEAKEHQYVLAIAEENGSFGLALADLSTGDFTVLETDNFEQAEREISRLQPKELVLPPHLFSQEDFRRLFPVVSTQKPNTDARQHLCTHFGTKTLKGFGIEEKALCTEAASLLLAFLEETQKGSVPHLKFLRLESMHDYIPLDPETIRHLELFVDAEGRKEGSLVAILDETKTAMGGRLLRASILRPLKNQKKIEARLDAVSELTENSGLADEIRKSLKEVSDPERLIAKISCGRANPRDFLALKQSLQKLPELEKGLKEMKGQKLREIRKLLAENG